MTELATLLSEVRDFLNDVSVGCEVTERSRDHATEFAALLDQYDFEQIGKLNTDLAIARSQLEKATAWQLIATIPKDGSSVLVTMAGGTDGPYYVLFWQGSYFEDVSSGVGPSLDHLTHWMPLQAPPDLSDD